MTNQIMLEPGLLLAAYRQGIFPMAVDKRGTIGWFSPDPRAIIPFDECFHIPHGLRRTLKRVVTREGEAPAEPSAAPSTRGSAGASPSQEFFHVTFNQHFPAVIKACSTSHGSTWISPEIIESYTELHRLGHAHSVEIRLKQKLVGGLYGVHIGGAFFGESMFHHATDASKIALVALVERLRNRNFLLLDTQWLTPHLAQFGTHEIPRADYLTRLAKALAADCKF